MGTLGKWMVNAAMGLLVLATAACSHVAPPYSAGIDNVNAAGKLRGTLAVGKFDFAAGHASELNTLQARADTYTSPVNGSYADYIADALKADLKAAGKLDEASPRKVTGIVEKNDLSAGGMSTNDAEVTVHFTLQDSGTTRYDKTLTAKHEWESSFMGAVAIPRAIQNYVVTLQKLLRQLYDDPDFRAATGR